MSRAAQNSSVHARPHTLGNRDAVTRLLRTSAGLRWPNGTLPRDLRIQGYWPIRDDGFLWEWSFKLATSQRYSIYGRPSGIPKANGRVEECAETNCHVADFDDNGLWDVRVYVPDLELTLHSPNRDPLMPHLPRCLDPGRMAQELCSAGVSNLDGRRSKSNPLRCRLLGYRPGRRAAIQYQVDGDNGEAITVIGKTYRGDAAERRAKLHGRLNAALLESSGGGVTVPAALGHLPDLHMFVFECAAGDASAAGDAPLSALAHRATDALLALHAAELDSLPTFTLEDECNVCTRWGAVIRKLDPQMTKLTDQLEEALLRAAESVETGPARTIHRDFYEKQIIFDGSKITILDLDTLASGSVCVDIGNLLAHLLLRLLMNGGKEPDFGALTTEMIRRYQSQGDPLDLRCLNFHVASSLYRLGAVHALRTKTGPHAPDLWNCAASLIADPNAGWMKG